LQRHSLAGISLFAILAEAVALGFFLKSTAISEHRGQIKPSWVSEAMAVYLLNPATLYWTVFQGYHSITQTAYSMVALYFLLRGYNILGYAVGLYSVAGVKFLALLDWPALLVVNRPRLAKLLLGAIPLLITVVVFYMITDSHFFLHRYYFTYISEGNIWFLLTSFKDLQNFYSTFLGNSLCIFFFSIFFLIGFVHWLTCLRLGRTSFSFQAAMGMMTFTVSLYFLFSLYPANYYVPILMLPACLVVTSPTLVSRYTIWLLLLISSFCIIGDAIWISLGQPFALIDVFLSGSFNEWLLAGFLIVSILVRIACFAILAQLGLRIATTSPSRSEATLSVA
jgi:hypothetical protein